MGYIKLLRVKHYIKNLLIFLPLFFYGGMFGLYNFLTVVIGWLIFNAIASAVYIINDINDVENDRKHPKKKNRPIASGIVSIRNAKIEVCCLLVLAIVLHCLFLGENIIAAVIVMMYLVINLIYSVGRGKNVPLLDVVILVLGFVLRVMYGACIVDVSISPWLYLVVISGAFFLGFGKRRNELAIGKQESRKVLKYYTKDFLDKNMYCCMTLSITFYSLWCVERNEDSKLNLIYTVPILLILLIRYSMLIEGDSDGDPVNTILSDKFIMLIGTVFVIMLFAIIYFV